MAKQVQNGEWEAPRNYRELLSLLNRLDYKRLIYGLWCVCWMLSEEKLTKIPYHWPIKEDMFLQDHDYDYLERLRDRLSYARLDEEELAIQFDVYNLYSQGVKRLIDILGDLTDPEHVRLLAVEEIVSSLVRLATSQLQSPLVGSFSRQKQISLKVNEITVRKFTDCMWEVDSKTHDALKEVPKHMENWWALCKQKFSFNEFETSQLE